MFNKIKNSINLIKNMGLRYIVFRSGYEIERRTGLLKRKFPIDPPNHAAVTLKQWRLCGGQFFFESKAALSFPKQPDPVIAERYETYLSGRLLFFNSIEYNIGHDYDWLTNPENGYRYDAAKHWTEIQDYSATAGDIKFVWEKSRFSFLYDIIRYDYHFGFDCASVVFDEITSWIDNNPINKGPNYRCSQEISLRVLNWIFALYYYKESPILTGEVFDKIQHAIYWQIHHVYHNINFSRIAVRNNHAITETLTLYLVHLIFPFVPDFAKWGDKGKKWFEQEIAYQIYDDGTFLQFSMNYHRVVVQLFTWGISMAKFNGQSFADVVGEKARKSLYFLRVCMDDTSGWLPNYGSNDGALFFKLNNSHFRDYRPQLCALAGVLGVDAGINNFVAEDNFWCGISTDVKSQIDLTPATYCFKDGGYYIIRDGESLIFTRCGNYKDRPFQADNLHLDVWHKNQNLLIDAGSYKYNTDNATLKYFMGTQSHNTVMLNDCDQMLKGSRFIWFDWSQCINATLTETDESFIFEGTISAYRYLSKNIQHTRKIVKKRGSLALEITDFLTNVPQEYIGKQLWHLFDTELDVLQLTANSDAECVEAQTGPCWYSGLYGQKESAIQITYQFKQGITTTIKLKGE